MPVAPALRRWPTCSVERPMSTASRASATAAETNRRGIASSTRSETPATATAPAVAANVHSSDRFTLRSVAAPPSTLVGPCGRSPARGAGIRGRTYRADRCLVLLFLGHGVGPRSMNAAERRQVIVQARETRLRAEHTCAEAQKMMAFAESIIRDVPGRRSGVTWATPQATIPATIAAMIGKKLDAGTLPIKSPMKLWAGQ